MWRSRRLGAYAERLGAIEWSLLALIAIAVAVSILMAIFDPA